ncbi:MAG: hypothetical protein Kow0027_28640 [Saprospiraceae bacterium]
MLGSPSGLAPAGQAQFLPACLSVGQTGRQTGLPALSDDRQAVRRPDLSVDRQAGRQTGVPQFFSSSVLYLVLKKVDKYVKD